MNINQLTLRDVTEDLLHTFERYQETCKVYRVVDGIISETKDSFIDEWSVDKKREICAHMKRTLAHQGAVLTIEEQKQMIAFAILEYKSFGVKHSYCELSYFHVTKLSRGKGIGRELFSAVKEVAKGMERDKLYIGAHPSVETISFYKSMGCTLTEEINQEIYLREPLDIQLECLL